MGSRRYPGAEFENALSLCVFARCTVVCTCEGADRRVFRGRNVPMSCPSLPSPLPDAQRLPPSRPRSHVVFPSEDDMSSELGGRAQHSARRENPRLAFRYPARAASTPPVIRVPREWIASHFGGT